MSTLIESVVCPFCGCLCDDIAAQVSDGHVISAQRACANGRGLFTAYDPTPKRPTVAGRAVKWEEAIAEAAHILGQADSPLIFGLSSTATEAQRKAVELADQLGAIIDTTSSICHGPTALAMQAVGQPGCTLGEVRQQADLLIFWGCNPAVSHPRHFKRYSAGAGDRGRTVVVVDVRRTASTRAADLFIQVRAGADFEVLTTLRALVQGREIETAAVGGVATAQLRELAESLKTCHFGVAFIGTGLTMSQGRDLNVSELLMLVAELNEYTRFSVIPMRGHGNVTGADQVLTWQSGYPFAVSFARGYPRYGPGEFSAVDMLARGEVDAALVLASDPVAHFPGAAARRLRNIPIVVLDPRLSLTMQRAEVVLPTACYGVDAAGTFYRMDGVPVRLRPPLPSIRPTDEQVLSQLIAAVRTC